MFNNDNKKIGRNFMNNLNKVPVTILTGFWALAKQHYLTEF